MLRQFLSILIVFALTGCGAKPEEIKAYYQALETTNAAILASIEEQRADNQLRRVDSMGKYSTAVSMAASTQSPTDDVIVAFAWGYAMGQKDEIEIPDLKTPAPPVSDVDRVRAWTPIIGMAMPFLYPIAYGWAAGAGSDTYSASGNAKINVSSENAGAFNTAGGNQTVETIDNKSEQDCYQCDLPDDGDVRTGTIDNCLTSPPGGFGPSGEPLWTPDCSCVSHFIHQDC